VGTDSGHLLFLVAIGPEVAPGSSFVPEQGSRSRAWPNSQQAGQPGFVGGLGDPAVFAHHTSDLVVLIVS
jgi:hypothetical protein